MAPIPKHRGTGELLNERLRILQVGPMPPPVDGGISSYIDGLLRSRLATEFELRTLDVRVSDRFRRQRVLRPLLTPLFVARLAVQLRRERPHAVHIHSSDFLGFWEKSLLAWCARLHHVPVLLHLHGGSFDHYFKTLPTVRKDWARRALAAADCVIVPAGGWRSLLEEFVAAERIAIVPNAVHRADFDAPRQPTDGDRLRILFVGMLSERKGLDELLAATRELLDSGHRNLQLDIVGGEEFLGELERYRKLYRDAGVDSWVRFHGHKLGAEKLGFYQRADIFVLPSRNESFGIVNLEAMASGLPVVSTRTGAIPEYLQHGVNGLLVDPGDARALAAAIRRLLDDPALRARLGAAARKSVGAYDWSAVAETIGALYRKVVLAEVAKPGRKISRDSRITS